MNATESIIGSIIILDRIFLLLKIFQAVDSLNEIDIRQNSGIKILNPPISASLRGTRWV